MSRFEAPITSWFVPRVTPYGAAPEEIKQGWIDVPLPLRYDRPEGPMPSLGAEVDGSGITVFEDSAIVISTDALKALRIFERDEAADWWEQYFGGRLSELAFAIEREDQVFPNGFMRLIMPGIETFDDLQI
jgi:hypothetical protein